MSMTHVRRLVLVFLALTVLGGCTPAQIAHWRSLGPDPVTAETMTPEQRAIAEHVQEQQRAWLAAAAARPRDCYSAMEKVFPPHTWAWGRSIIHRESRNQPAAANPASTARGCWQLLMSLHSHRFTAVGCSPSQWADPLCNTKAAYHLYQAAGTSPWRL
jgi:hypothetical protein